MGADYVVGAWTLGGEVVASGERYSDVGERRRMGGYALTNVSASYRVDNNVSLFARVNNLFNKKYELVDDFAVPGVNVLVGLRYQPR